MKSIRVVAAVVRRGDALLVTRRKDAPGRLGQWEFPGGKVEAGEREEEALAREIGEELGCEATVERLLLRHRHRYPDFSVDLAFYACDLRSEPAPIGVAELRWAKEGSLAALDFLEADRAVLGEIARLSAAPPDR